MKDRLESKFSPSASMRKKQFVIYLVVLLVVLFVSLVVFRTSIESKEPPVVVMRVDDIQDFGFREAQLFLLEESVVNNVSLSLAVIPGMFGEDTEVVRAVRLALVSGSEVTVHGWKHENFAELSFEEQALLLSQSRNRIKETLNYDAKIFVPPMFGFNEDTIAAMHQEGYSIISTMTDYTEPGLTSEVFSLPASIELSDFSNGIWSMKSCDSVKAEVSKSIQQYGFAVIVTHPQEFMEGTKLNQANMESYHATLIALKEGYSFSTLERLGEKWLQ